MTRELTGAEQWQILRDLKAGRLLEEIATDFGRTWSTLQRWIDADEDLAEAVADAKKEGRKNRVPEHGTSSRYRRHGCRCGLCRRTETERKNCSRERLAARFRAGAVEPVHGRPETYRNYACRCRPCTTAASAARRRYRNREKKAA